MIDLIDEIDAEGTLVHEMMWMKRPCTYMGAFVPSDLAPHVDGKRCYWYRYGTLGQDLRDIIIPIDEFWPTQHNRERDLNSKKLKRLINLLIAKGVITDEEINGPQLVYRHSHAAYDE